LTVGAVVVFRGALRLYFAQEDFRGLAVAAGIYPRHWQLWRYLSVQTFMDVFYPFFRDRPWPYHAVSLALHCLNAGLLFILLGKPVSRSAALIGATFFAVHPALFTALYWHSARADILAAFFALVTFVLALRRGRERWVAAPAFACALLSKESVLPLPAVIWLWERWRAHKSAEDGSPTRRSWTTVALAAMSLLYGLYLARASVGVAPRLGSGPAYAMDFGAPLVGNLLTYVGWTVDIAMVRPGMRFVDAQNPELFGLGVVVLLIAGLLALWPALRRHGWFIAIGSYLLLLIPVLPLKNHTYHYYLYLPLMAAAACVAMLSDAVLASLAPRKRMPRVEKAHGQIDSAAMTGVVAIACWLLLGWNGARLVKEMERRPSPVYPGLRGDPIVDRSLIAERMLDGLRSAVIPAGTELEFIMRERLALLARIARGSREEPPPAQEVYPETNVKTALFDGVGVRAIFPDVDSVTFTSTLGQPTARRRYAVYAPTGEVEVFDAASLDSLLRSSWVTRW
jgi:hypothetical protein